MVLHCDKTYNRFSLRLNASTMSIMFSPNTLEPISDCLQHTVVSVLAFVAECLATGTNMTMATHKKIKRSRTISHHRAVPTMNSTATTAMGAGTGCYVVLPSTAMFPHCSYACQAFLSFLRSRKPLKRSERAHRGQCTLWRVALHVALPYLLGGSLT